VVSYCDPTQTSTACVLRSLSIARILTKAVDSRIDSSLEFHTTNNMQYQSRRSELQDCCRTSATVSIYPIPKLVGRIASASGRSRQFRTLISISGSSFKLDIHSSHYYSSILEGFDCGPSRRLRPPEYLTSFFSVAKTPISSLHTDSLHATLYIDLLFI
jgi:hypothetical protein